jgi:hypothetical protein
VTAIIGDTSAVLASLDQAYAEHEAIAAIITGADGLLVVSPMVAAESDYMLFTRLGAAVCAIPAPQFTHSPDKTRDEGCQFILRFTWGGNSHP